MSVEVVKIQDRFEFKMICKLENSLENRKWFLFSNRPWARFPQRPNQLPPSLVSFSLIPSLVQCQPAQLCVKPSSPHWPSCSWSLNRLTRHPYPARHPEPSARTISAAASLRSKAHLTDPGWFHLHAHVVGLKDCRTGQPYAELDRAKRKLIPKTIASGKNSKSHIK
jgi:hypothetical protein